VGHCGAEISNSCTSNKLSSFSPEGFETALFQNGFLACRSPAKIDLCLKLKSSVMSESFQAQPGDLQTAASMTSLLPIGMQTPVASTEIRGGRSTWLWGMPFLTATAVSPFLLGCRFGKSQNLG
jgi:hypothetical protein